MSCGFRSTVLLVLGLLLVAACPASGKALEDREWIERNILRIRTTRARLTARLRHLGFDVVDSQANFVWATHPHRGHRNIYEALKDRRILVRYMQFPEASAHSSGEVDGLRITVGTDQQIDRFLDVLQEIG